MVSERQARDRLERELAERLGLVPSRRVSRRRFRRCVYCGTHSYGRACPSHRDLAQLERV